ncbi:MAG TPA: tRNA (adenosine(37)-N6)-threonylcarbamoyltransferase complex dimerization subunit type 1 TsaB [Gemmatimonadales bacterium]|nr:tRNA (adenosine(37)-N6)-threonylcarbamoyltransferase complex dimerization subunit type 1 TsaB [Gemmatimonadales bacterium]
MIWLALDTATDRASIALGGPGEYLATETIVGARRHASALLPAIEACLERARLGYGDLEGLVLADGPGSFTGLRVGATVTRALTRARRLPLWVAPSLLVAAAGVAAPVGQAVVAVSNALRGELFAAAYRFGPGTAECLLRPTVLRPADLDRLVPRPFLVGGPSAGVLGGEPNWPEAVKLLDLVGLAGGARWVADPARWEPDYGRPAEAQAKWEREHGRPLADPAGHRG